MKGKEYRMALLLDYFGPMLTEKQREDMDLYYNEDLSLAEIAEHSRISRQGVRDSIKRGEAYIEELEGKLHIVEKIEELQKTVAEMAKIASELNQLNAEVYMARPIHEKTAAIIDIAKNALSDSES